MIFTVLLLLCLLNDMLSYEFKDPDPEQNVTDPEHYFQASASWLYPCCQEASSDPRTIWRTWIPDTSEVDDMYVDCVPAVLDELPGRGLAQGAGGQLTGAQQQAAHQAVWRHARQLLFADKYISHNF